MDDIGDDIMVKQAMEVLDSRWTTAGPWNLPYRVLLVAKLIDRVTARHVRDTAQLSLAQWRALTHVAHLQPCSASTISGIAMVDRAEVSRALGALEEAGLIRREANPKNRKSNLVSLTEKGEEIHAAVRGERGGFYRDWLADISEEDRATIDAGLRCIAGRIVARSPDILDV